MNDSEVVLFDNVCDQKDGLRKSTSSTVNAKVSKVELGTVKTTVVVVDCWANPSDCYKLILPFKSKSKLTVFDSVANHKFAPLETSEVMAFAIAVKRQVNS